jgi:catechol 2,3-dioxygenase-like lactoylglutathione lyase family enzyme
MITGLNHITLAVKNVEISFAFYRDVLGFTPLCKWEGCAYFLIGQPDQPNAIWLSLDRDTHHQTTQCRTHYAFSVSPNDFTHLSNRILNSGAPVYKKNTSPEESLYFLDPDGHKLEIHVGSWQSRIDAKKSNPGNWKNVEWYV